MVPELVCDSRIAFYDSQRILRLMGDTLLLDSFDYMGNRVKGYCDCEHAAECPKRFQAFGLTRYCLVRLL